MLYDAHEMLLRRKLEEAELQQAIELQGRRLMNMQLPDFKNNRLPQHYLPHHIRSLSVGAPVTLIPQSHAQINQNVIPFDSMKQEVAEGLGDMAPASFSLSAAVSEHQNQKEVNNATDEGKEQGSDVEAHVLHERVDQVLPDSLFASPKNSGGDHTVAADFNESIVVSENNSSTSVKSATCTASQ